MALSRLVIGRMEKEIPDTSEVELFIQIKVFSRVTTLRDSNMRKVNTTGLMETSMRATT